MYNQSLWALVQTEEVLLIAKVGLLSLVPRLLPPSAQ